MKMPEPNGYRFRVYKATNVDGAIQFTAFYNDTTLYGCVDYMKRWNDKQIHNWYIEDVDANVKFKININNELVMI